MQKGILIAFAVGVISTASGSSAYADATAFIGATTTPANRLTKGLAVGTGLIIVGFEFEYSVTSEDFSATAPSLKTGSGNVLLQAPIPGFQPYVTTGLTIYRERLGPAYKQTGVAPNVGAGVKLTLAGPLRLRVDYRTFKLGSGALYSPAHRIYAGLNFSF